MMANLRVSGLTPGLIVSVGLVMLTLVAVVRRHHEAVQLQLQLCLDDGQANTEHLEYLVEAQQQTLSRRPASGEELEQVLHSLARQDDKINNLTKALKMYGKPLVDVNRLATENGQKSRAIAAQVGDLREKIEKMNEGMLDPMVEMLTRVSREGTDELHSKLDTMDEKLLDPIADLLSKNSRANNDDLMRMLELLSEQISGEVAKAMSSVPQGGNADEVVTALRQDFTEIRDTLIQIQLDASAAKAAASSAAAFAPAPSAAPSPPRPAPAPTPPAAPKMSGIAKSPGKSVLGAIAKLKKMR